MSYYIEGFEVENLWGYKHMRLSFKRDVNILIGPNASGKTTILNLLRYILTPDPLSLNEIGFSQVVVWLRSFKGSSKRTIRVKRTDGGFDFMISRRRFPIYLDLLSRFRPERLDKSRQLILSREVFGELFEHLGKLVPAVWLPVSRRLPITGEEDQLDFEIRKRSGSPSTSLLETVDVRLSKLIKELTNYRLRLDAQLSEHYKNDFEKRVLETILYSKEYDQIESLKLGSPPTDDEKKQFIRAFQAAGLLDPQMRERIDEHFGTAKEALVRIAESQGKGITLSDVFIIPLIERTRSIVRFAGEMDRYRDNLFAPLRDYEKKVNSFLNEKRAKVEEDGNLIIKTLPAQQEISPQLLSSGEKQILILLTQALLWEDRPIVYVVDEPELSLHVTWQEKLLESLLELGKEIQVIVATHSPDIVGRYGDNVIDLGERS